MENTKTGLTYQKVLEFDSTKPSLENVYQNHSDIINFINFGRGSSKALKNLNQYILVEIPLSDIVSDEWQLERLRLRFKYGMRYTSIILLFDPVTFEYKKQMKSFLGHSFPIESLKKGIQLLEKLNQSKIQSQEELLNSLNL